MSDDPGVWEVRLGLYATEQQAEEVKDRITRMLCPDPDHAPPCPIPWSMSGIFPASDLDEPDPYPELVEQARFERLLGKSRLVAAALDEAGIDPRIRELPDSTRTAADAAQALGCPVAAIANSLVFVHDDAPLLVMTSGGNRVDTAALAERLGGGSVVRAEPDRVREATGQAIGGVAPLGHPEPITTVVDESLAEHAVIWAAAGTPHTVFPTTYRDLLAATGGRAARVTP